MGAGESPADVFILSVDACSSDSSSAATEAEGKKVTTFVQRLEDFNASQVRGGRLGSYPRIG